MSNLYLKYELARDTAGTPENENEISIYGKCTHFSSIIYGLCTYTFLIE